MVQISDVDLCEFDVYFHIYSLIVSNAAGLEQIRAMIEAQML